MAKVIGKRVFFTKYQMSNFIYKKSDRGLSEQKRLDIKDDIESNAPFLVGDPEDFFSAIEKHKEHINLSGQNPDIYKFVKNCTRERCNPASFYPSGEIKVGKDGRAGRGGLKYSKVQVVAFLNDYFDIKEDSELTKKIPQTVSRSGLENILQEYFIGIRSLTSAGLSTMDSKGYGPRWYPKNGNGQKPLLITKEDIDNFKKQQSKEKEKQESTVNERAMHAEKMLYLIMTNHCSVTLDDAKEPMFFPEGSEASKVALDHLKNYGWITSEQIAQ